jgi:uncharacterized Zn finger protein (UPF0148 family)
VSHDHSDHDHDHEHEHEQDGDDVDAATWFRGADKQLCPACGASGAFVLGGGLFCPSCGEVTTNPGYQGSKSE